MSLIRCCPSGRYRRRRSESEAVKDYRRVTRVLKGAYSLVSCIAVGSLCSTGHVRNRSGRDPTTSSVSRPSSARGRRRRVMSVSSASELQTNKGGMPWFRLSTPRVLNCPPWSFGLELQIDVAKCGYQSRVLHYSGSARHIVTATSRQDLHRSQYKLRNVPCLHAGELSPCLYARDHAATTA